MAFPYVCKGLAAEKFKFKRVIKANPSVPKRLFEIWNFGKPCCGHQVWLYLSAETSEKTQSEAGKQGLKKNSVTSMI